MRKASGSHGTVNAGTLAVAQGRGMAFKHNADRRHHIPEARYRVRNCSDYGQQANRASTTPPIAGSQGPVLWPPPWTSAAGPGDNGTGRGSWA